MTAPGTNRRRRHGRLVVLLVAIVPLAWLTWAVHWALTATPAGSAGLERALADVARCEGTGLVADGSA